MKGKIKNERNAENNVPSTYIRFQNRLDSISNNSYFQLVFTLRRSRIGALLLPPATNNNQE
jgi:hypothetical protein